MSHSDREFQVILQGATGFTGRLVAEHLLRRHGLGGSLRWAIAGRNTAKLGSVRDEVGRETGIDASALPILTADAGDEAAMRNLAERASVVCTTVGPYALYGSGLVAACAAAGTDYCDLTGEVHWMRQMIDAHQAAAQESGARIVHTCGFDCIPADVGTHFLQKAMRARHGVASPRVKMRVAGFSGGASGGTIASMLAMMDAAGEDPEVMRIMNDPYALNPEGQREGPDQAETMAPRNDADFEQWVAPFMMAGVDTKVVRRTNALLGHAYGQGFRYDEGVLCGPGPRGWAKATSTAAGTAGGMAAMAVGPLRRAIGGRLPQPGEGPSKAKREAGHFEIEFWAAHPEDRGKSLRARVTGDRDPGYGSTAKMLGESAACLALDELPAGGGFHTPASAMGDPLLARLQEHAGLTFEIEER
jgi:short subunit dehydrogenase-like uncharacterized protein